MVKDAVENRGLYRVLAHKRAFQPGTKYVFEAFSGGKRAVPGTVPLHPLGGTSQ